MLREINRQHQENGNSGHVQVRFRRFEAIPKVCEPGSVTDPGSLDKLY